MELETSNGGYLKAPAERAFGPEISGKLRLLGVWGPSTERHPERSEGSRQN